MAVTTGFKVIGALVVLALAVAAASSSPGVSDAGGNAVWLDPPDANVIPDGVRDVRLVADPPPVQGNAGSLALWAIRIRFDPGVVTVAQHSGAYLCRPMASPPGSSSASTCDITDEDEESPGVVDTAVSVGTIVFPDTHLGLTAETVLATVAFQAVGELGDCGSLTIEVEVYDDLQTDDDPIPFPPSIQHGEICVVEPASLTAVWGDVDCAGDLTISDALKTARHLLGWTVEQEEPCVKPGDWVMVDGANHRWGDTDCDTNLAIGDTIKLARKLLGLSASQQKLCPAIGAEIEAWYAP